MDDRLFKGQIRPAAQPIGSLSSRLNSTLRLPVSGQAWVASREITTIHQAGTSSVAGFNQAEQIAKALGGLNKNLTNLLHDGIVTYAKESVEAGYQEELTNAANRAKLVPAGAAGDGRPAGCPATAAAGQG